MIETSVTKELNNIVFALYSFVIPAIHVHKLDDKISMKETSPWPFHSIMIREG